MNQLYDTRAQLGLMDLYMLMAVVLWSLNFSIIKIALREFSPLAFNGVRLVLASGLLLLFLRIQREKIKLPPRDLGVFLLLGVVGTTFYQLCFIHGLNWTTASNSALIIALAPAIIALVSTAFRHERLSWLTWGGIGISFGGLYLVITQRGGGFVWSLDNLKGDLLIFTANFLWAVYTVKAKPLLRRYSPLKFTAWTMALGTIFFLPFAARDMSHLARTKISLAAWGALVFSAVFALAVCYVIWYSSVKRVGNSRTAIYDNLIPLLTVLFAFLILEERLSLGQALGAGIIIIGVIMTRFGRVESR